MHTIKARIAAGRDRGATPLEILAGLVLLGIIFGFLIVKFFGWRQNTQDKGAQTTLRNALLAAETIYQADQNYLGEGGATDADAVAALTGVEPEVTFDEIANIDFDVKDPNIVYVDATTAPTADVDSGQAIEMYAISDSGNAFCVLSVADSDTITDVGTYYNAAPEGAGALDCGVGDDDDGFPGV